VQKDNWTLDAKETAQARGQLLDKHYLLSVARAVIAPIRISGSRRV
jgi:hypothetical protein